jgi:hypothetical protein
MTPVGPIAHLGKREEVFVGWAVLILEWYHARETVAITFRIGMAC